MTPDARRRFAALTTTLAVYAACGNSNTPEPHVGTHETDKLDYAQPATIEDATDYIVPRPTQRRTARSRPRPTPPARPGRDAAGDGGIWHQLAICESGGNPTARSASGRYTGAFQFSDATWQSLGYAGSAADHPYSTQLEAAQRLQARSGFGQWPKCARQLGLL